MAPRLTTTGVWPEEITIRTTWAKAIGRPWNDDLPHGYLRLVRGSSAFVRAAAEHVADQGVELVASPPLAAGADGLWRKAGFGDHLSLHLYRRSLVATPPPEDPEIIELPAEFGTLYEIDREAFNETWRMNPLGLRESYKATSRSVIIGTPSAGDLAGYAIVGASGVTGYLQRIAVDPARQRQGHGRRLVKAAIRWASHHGAATMLLNTQPENDSSAALYRSEGFARMPGDLQVLGFRR